jgi:hypothetical protein
VPSAGKLVLLDNWKCPVTVKLGRLDMTEMRPLGLNSGVSSPDDF